MNLFTGDAKLIKISSPRPTMRPKQKESKTLEEETAVVHQDTSSATSPIDDLPSIDSFPTHRFDKVIIH